MRKVGKSTPFIVVTLCINGNELKVIPLKLAVTNSIVSRGDSTNYANS